MAAVHEACNPAVLEDLYTKATLLELGLYAISAERSERGEDDNITAVHWLALEIQGKLRELLTRETGGQTTEVA
jgi:hypothetical protein